MEKVSLVLTENAISSLRESDFDTCSALGEVIDNSLQAGASEIILSTKEVELPAQGRRPVGTTRVIELAFGDDGLGMDATTLHHCMQLGYSTRYNDRTGIGRFGVGMTLGAINQCRRIEIYSKIKDAPSWLFTYVDLDDIFDNPYIPEPQERELPEEYGHCAGQSHGTLVLWKKCDRISTSVEEIKHWIGRTYRKFIGPRIVTKATLIENSTPITVALNNEKINAFDPLYAVPSEHFPENTAATLYEEIHFEMLVPSDADVSYRTSPVTIRMSLLPQQWRKAAGDGGNSLAKKLHIPDNEGFSILRAGREVFYDVMPRFEPKVNSDGIDRWWSAEICFDPVLDSYFTVRNIKRGAHFVKDLREKVQDLMRPTILESRREVLKIYKAARQNSTYNETNVTTEHTEAEVTVKSVVPTPGKAGKEKTEEEKIQEIEEILRHIVNSEDELSAWRAKIESQPCTIVDNEGNSWKGTTFIDIHPQGGRTIIEYNRAHEFFLFIYNVIKELTDVRGKKDIEEIIDDAKKLKTAIDLLFMAYAQAEAQIAVDHEQPAGDTLEILRTNWGTFLKQYIRSYEKSR